MAEAVDVSSIFGENVFNDAVMKARLPKDVYKSFRKTVDESAHLDPAIADVMANAMKDWAIEKGATHYCHWFQPMTGLTAEKHDSFISPTRDGKIVMEFSGKELVQGEPDASSFPSGGLRATFEARGYTAWDCTSPVFVKEDGKNTTLFIPCAFCSYTGETLDKKTPLLRSMDALDKQAMRVLRALGNTTSKHVVATLGAEQEYFLIDKDFYDARLDLMLTGRTLFGAPAPRGQEMDDHYFGSLNHRVATFMSELNIELWKLGVSSKTQHNEVSPAQYETAPVYATVNVATDHNQLTMQVMQKLAEHHGFACLLHEKPFAGVNGSGKHNNWAISTDDGINLLNPGSTPHENMSFLIFLCAVIKAVDKYAKILRASVATAGNEHRLGANEAPPAIISVFLGEQLGDIFDQLASGAAKSSKEGGTLELGVSTLPDLPKDSTDRNRTSPFAFTGNRFEFRMAGSSQSTAGPNVVLNTIVADALCDIADELEGADDIPATVQKILSRIANDHKRVVFNGDNYSQDWVEEAQKRGLPNMPNSADCFEAYLEEESVKVFEKHGVLNRSEIKARVEILLESYSMILGIEAKTALKMVKTQIMPAMLRYSSDLANTVANVKAAGADATAQKELLDEFCGLISDVKEKTQKLEKLSQEATAIDDAKKRADAYKLSVLPAMDELRAKVDAAEVVCGYDYWPLPTYSEMLFVK